MEKTEPGRRNWKQPDRVQGSAPGVRPIERKEKQIMSIPVTTIWAAILAAVLPLAAFGMILIGCRRRSSTSATLSIGAMSMSLACAVYLLATHGSAGVPLAFAKKWMVSGNLHITVGFLLDPLSLLMMVIVTAICFLVQMYSLAYMAGDPGFGRYYAFMSLFAWAMISLTLAPNLLQLYVFWELVGLSSYLLIGFWFEKFSASRAGKKAFIMTRVGDVAFLLGLLLLLAHHGNLDILNLNDPETTAHMRPMVITLSSLLIFGGIIGKSAQFPLFTWLPDAMEGPTPVSALLHSATMVAAGVYLFARLFPFLGHSPFAMTVFLFIGTLSMLMASCMAMVSRDIKQVWAYSTISQLGFMIMGLGAGGYFGGVFHLTAHAGFKALLFLCAGVLIHAFHTNDMFEISRQNGRRMRITMTCMVVAGAALAGIWPFSGFYSKEVILGRLAALDNPIWLLAGLAGAFLTAYYTFRLVFIILFPRPEPHVARDAHGGHRESWIMTVPLMVLAAVTLVLGHLERPLAALIAGGDSVSKVNGNPAWLPPLAMGLCAAGVLLAWIEFGRKGARQSGFVEQWPVLTRLFAERWYLDRFYAWLVDRVVDRGASAWCAQNDIRRIDGAAHALADSAVNTGRVLATWHRGLVQPKLMVMLAVFFYLTITLLF